MARTKVTTRDELLIILHQITVELCIMQELKKPLKRVCDILEHQPQILALINQVEVKPSSDLPTGVLTFPSEEAKTTLFAFFEDFDKVYSEPDAQPDSTMAETSPETEANAAGAVCSVEAGEAGTVGLVEAGEAGEAGETSTVGSAEASEASVSPDARSLEVRQPTNLDFLSISLSDPKFQFAVSS